MSTKRVQETHLFEFPYRAHEVVGLGSFTSEDLDVFVQIRKGGSPERRIARIGVNKVVNHCLLKAGLKKPEISCHALRHTCGTLLYQATRDIRVVQETLGHEDISTSAGYAHVVERGKARHTREIPVKLGKS